MVAFRVSELEYIDATTGQRMIYGKLCHAPQTGYNFFAVIISYATMPESISHLTGPFREDTFLIRKTFAIIIPTSL